MIEIRPIQPSDGQALNDKLIANWPSATHGPAAWLVWHKDAVAASPQNVGFVAIDTETNKLIGSVLTRYRTKEYSPAMESDANGEIQSWWRAELSDLDSSDIDTINSYKLMENWGKCYEKSAEDVHTWLAGKSYLYVRQMGVDPEYRNQGVGTLLLQKFLDEARIRNCDAVQLESWGKGKEFYAKNGGKEYGDFSPLSLTDGVTAEKYTQSAVIWFFNQ